MSNHFFAGANTAKGFFSYYDYLAKDSYTRVFILKGGPGTGKSTMLKKIAAELQDSYTVDRFHCSADLNSLDGIYIHGLEVSMLDGTAPHVTDPRLPGAVQRIVDLGTCWNPNELIKNKKIIQDLSDQITLQYKIAYKWLAVAAGQADLVQELERTSSIEKQAKADAIKIAEFLPANALGQNRKAFASAITGDGFHDFTSGMQQNKNNVYLLGGNRTYNYVVLHRIQQLLEDREIPATYLYCGLQPEYLEHIYIPGKLGIFSVHRPHLLDVGQNVFGFDVMSETELESCLFKTIDQGIATLSEARRLHMELEKLYVPHVNFGAVEEIQQNILHEIKQYK